MSLVILSSGNLGLTVLKKIREKYQVIAVLTDSNSKSIIEYCLSENIPYYAGNPRKNRGSEFLKNYSVDFIFSVNYLYLIEIDLIKTAKKYCLNIHGALLPQFRGRTPHVWAIIKGETESGITVHNIVPECDAGDVVYQEKVLISKEMTGGELLAHFNERYPPIVLEVIEKAFKNQLTFTKQDESKSSYFGKRTPEDGEIDWNLKGNDIYNWVRAQTAPYPGAFSFFNGKKVIIYKVIFNKKLVDQKILNGTILSIKNNQATIKVSDGEIVITETDPKLFFTNTF